MTAPTPPTPPKPPKAKPYITIIPGRSPEQKAHTSRGMATNALKYMTRPGTMWRQEGDEWVLAATAVVVKVESNKGTWWDRNLLEIHWEEGEAP